MTVPSNASLLEPISVDRPCGQSLDDTGDTALLEAYQIFGQDSLDPPKGPQPKREPRKSDRPPNWAELQELAGACVAKSKDFRALAHLGACALRTQGLVAFVDLLAVAHHWLETYWDTVYPLVEEDAVLRTNALTCFSDRSAIIDGLRRAPLVVGPLGRFSYRDLEAAAAPAPEGEDAPPPPDHKAIAGAFGAMPIADLRTLHDRVIEGAASLNAIERRMQEGAGVEASPALDGVLALLGSIAAALKTRLADHPDAVAGVDEAGAGGTDAAGAAGLGAVRTRQDAIRALDAVADFFRRSEPSSPVPLIVDRAKRLVSKDFLEVLAELAPTGLSEAKSAGGIRE
jgi:type VI secretion system protein ImpA